MSKDHPCEEAATTSLLELHGKETLYEQSGFNK